ncbi:MAG: hypothetical protein AB7O80_16070 [Acetobacteraceae bacterium]
MLSRLVHGTRISLQARVLSAFVGASVSMLVGVARAHLGGKTDLIVQRIIDAMMALPPLILAISIMAGLGAPPGVSGPGLRIAVARRLARFDGGPLSP